MLIKARTFEPKIISNPNPLYFPSVPIGFSLVIDTREQNPYRFNDIEISVVKQKLDSCDYSIKGFEDRILIERKSQSDFYGSITGDRERFKAMWDRCRGVEFLGLLIECTEEELYHPEVTFSDIKPNSIYGTINSLEIKYNIHVYCGTRDMCRQKLINWLVKFYNTKRSL